MDYRKVEIRGKEYYVLDLPPNEYGKRKRLYGSSVEELENKYEYAKKLLEIKQSVEHPDENAPFSEYVLFLFRNGNGKTISPSLRRKRMQLLDALIVNSAIDIPIQKLNEKKLTDFLTSLRETYSEQTVESVRSIISETISLPFVLERWPLDARKVFAEEPIDQDEKSCFLTKAQIDTMKNYCIAPYSEKFGVGKELLMFLLCSGIKVKDLISAKRSAVDAEAGTFTTEDGIVIPLRNMDMSWLKKFLKKRDSLYGEDGLLFYRDEKKPLTRTSAGMTVSRIAHICEMPNGCTANAIHRSIVCHLLEDGVNPFEIAEWYGYRKVDAVLELAKDKRIYLAIHKR